MYPSPTPQPLHGPRRLLASAWAANWPLTLTALTMLLVLAAALIGLSIDPRVITGQPAWLKPAKFACSIAIYSLTFVWMLGFVRGRWRRLADRAANVTAVALVVEIVIISAQALRGVGSHFNISTPLDTALFSLMGTGIVVAWAMGVVLAVLLLRQRIDDAALAWGLRLGITIGIVGAGLAFTMTWPTGGQRAAWAAGAPVTVSGAHAVSAPDDGPGLPLLGWSTTGGDLRVAHFIGLHAMQVLPFVAWLVRRRDLGERYRVALVLVAGAGYLGLVLLALWQALRGQPLIAPDSLTLAALIALSAAVAAAGAAILWRARSATALAPRLDSQVQ